MNLQELFDSATFESLIIGDDRPFNAKNITWQSHPYINGYRVDVVERVDKGIVIAEIVEDGERRFEEVSKEKLEQILAIEYDPYNDASFSHDLLKIFNI